MSIPYLLSYLFWGIPMLFLVMTPMVIIVGIITDCTSYFYNKPDLKITAQVLNSKIKVGFFCIYVRGMYKGKEVTLQVISSSYTLRDFI